MYCVENSVSELNIAFQSDSRAGDCPYLQSVKKANVAETPQNAN